MRSSTGLPTGLTVATVAAGVCLLTGACGGGGEAGASPATPGVHQGRPAGAMAPPLDPTAPPRAADVTVGLEHDNGHLPLKLRQTLAVQLAGNPTTGYVWELREVDTGILRRDGEVSYAPANPAASPRPGAGGVFTARFTAIRAGETWLTLVYHRPFEKTSPATHAFTVHVMVS